MYRLLVISVSACIAALIGNYASARPATKDGLTFTVVSQVRDSLYKDAPIDRIGDQPVQVRAADYNPDYARRILLPALRKSVAVSVCDRNGSQYLYLIAGRAPGLFLKRTRDGRLHQVAGSPSGSDTMAAAFSEYDHSGRQSLFTAGAEGIRLYRNNGRDLFSDVTQRAGLQSTPGVVYTSIAVGDIDGDGFPDLLAGAYTNLYRAAPQAAFTFPNDFKGTSSRLYRNNRDGTFSDVTGPAGLDKNPGRCRKVVLADFNGDRRLDILLLRDDKPPALYLNRGGLKFEDVTWQAGDDLTTHAFFEGSAGDFNGDGKSDLALWSTHSFRILINEGGAVFERLIARDMPEPMISVFGFRGTAADLDGKGFEDLLTVDQNGRLRAFANDAGKFHEVLFALPDGYEAAYLVPLPFQDSREGCLLAICPDGRMAVIARVRGSGHGGVK